MLRRLVLLSLVFFSLKAESQQWCIDYPSDENVSICLIGGDMSHEYNYSVGFKYNQMTGRYSPVALCIDEAGNYNDRSYHEIIEKGYFCYALGMGDGNAFVVARCGNDVENEVYENLWVAVINPELEVVTEKYIEIEDPYVSYGYTIHALINNDNEIVVVTQVTDDVTMVSGNSYDYAFYKIDYDCNLLRCSYLKNTSSNAGITDFTLVPNTNIYAVFGDGMNHNNVESVFYIDDDLNFISCTLFDDPSNYPNFLFPENMCVDHWFDEKTFLMSAQSSQTTGVNKWKPLVLKMDVDMNVIDVLDLERPDTTYYVSQYRSMAYVDENTIYVSTYWHRNSWNEYLPNVATIFLMNEKLELLGRKDFEMENFFNVLHVQPTSDKGCVVQGYVDDGKHKKTLIFKLSKSDFEISADVLEYDCYDVNVYPNPVSSLLYIDIENLNKKSLSVRIIDELGRRYLDKDVVVDGNVISLDVSTLSNGLYFYQIECDKDKCINNFFVKE